ncbi:hypothetical protein D9757_002992 [Collybiopsis confluens]|uniref:Ubiquitin-like protease family profile domain-containing protein n=1 Tax=Collybiopsis confluens TaxID=2823264 RepID=A0A8H5HXC1_9AGAR|nr:hypothetical protein D9757_002992 [Collybiopsis confluens]
MVLFCIAFHSANFAYEVLAVGYALPFVGLPMEPDVVSAIWPQLSFIAFKPVNSTWEEPGSRLFFIAFNSANSAYEVLDCRICFAFHRFAPSFIAFKPVNLTWKLLGCGKRVRFWLSSYWVSEDPEDALPGSSGNQERKKIHKNCLPVDCPPFGISRSCTSPILQQISDTANACKQYVPSISLHKLLTLCSIEQLDAIVTLDFPTLAPASNNQFYLALRLQINQLQEAARVLSRAATIQISITSSLKVHRRVDHDTLPSDNAARVAIRNLKTLYGCINRRRLAVESALWKALDDFPQQTEARLRALVDQVLTFFTPGSTFSKMHEFSDSEDAFKGKLRYVTLSNFQTLGVGRWIDDEVVNYFVTKWCSESGTTLGLSTFFATKFLFEPGTCNPRGGFVTEADEDLIERWCCRAADNLGLKSWDSVYIPINENRAHWYSARIDFLEKRIDIYDSLRDRCLENRQKPPLLRKNAKLMLILMWLTEVLSRLRGDEVQLQNKLGSGWPNAHDCGVHTLWHLRHILDFCQIRLGAECSPVHLRFTDDMVGKRLRLAQEMVEDSSLA